MEKKGKEDIPEDIAAMNFEVALAELEGIVKDLSLIHI